MEEEKAICTMNSNVQIPTERESQMRKGRMEGLFLYEKEFEECQLQQLCFHSLLIHEGKKVRELENLQILLSFTVIPIQILPPGNSSSRSRLP